VNTSHTENIHKLWDKTIGIISLSLEKIEDIFRTSLGEMKSSSVIDSNFVSHRDNILTGLNLSDWMALPPVAPKLLVK